MRYILGHKYELGLMEFSMVKRNECWPDTTGANSCSSYSKSVIFNISSFDSVPRFNQFQFVALNGKSYDPSTFCSCAMRTCSRKLYLFLNFFWQWSHWRGGCGWCCVRICLQRLTVVITNLQYWHCDHLLADASKNKKTERINDKNHEFVKFGQFELFRELDQATIISG